MRKLTLKARLEALLAEAEDVLEQVRQDSARYGKAKRNSDIGELLIRLGQLGAEVDAGTAPKRTATDYSYRPPKASAATPKRKASVPKRLREEIEKVGFPTVDIL